MTTIVRRTEPADAESIAMLRMALAGKTAGKQFAKPIEKHEYIAHTIHYFEKAIADESYIGWVLEHKKRIVGVGGVTPLYGVPTPDNPSGMAWVLSDAAVQSDHEESRPLILNAVMELAKEYGVDHIWQRSAPDEMALYKK